MHVQWQALTRTAMPMAMTRLRDWHCCCLVVLHHGCCVMVTLVECTISDGHGPMPMAIPMVSLLLI